MRFGNYFYLEECLISKYVKLTRLDERYELIYILLPVVCRYMHGCLSVRLSVYFQFHMLHFKLFLHRYINFIHNLITNSFALIFRAQQ